MHDQVRVKIVASVTLALLPACSSSFRIVHPSGRCSMGSPLIDDT